MYLFAFTLCCHKVKVYIVFTAGIFTGQTFVLSSEVNHDLRPLIHQLVESGGGTLTAVGGAGSAGDSHMVCPVVSVSQLIMTTLLLFVGW